MFFGVLEPIIEILSVFGLLPLKHMFFGVLEARILSAVSVFGI